MMKDLLFLMLISKKNIKNININLIYIYIQNSEKQDYDRDKTIEIFVDFCIYFI